MCAWSNSHVQLFVTQWTVARQALLSLAFSRQEYWSGLPCPPPGESSYPRIEPSLPHCRQILCLMGRQGSFTDTIFHLKGWHGFSVLNILVMFSQKQLEGDYCHKEHYWWNFFLKPRIIWALKQNWDFEKRASATVTMIVFQSLQTFMMRQSDIVEYKCLKNLHNSGNQHFAINKWLMLQNYTS